MENLNNKKSKEIVAYYTVAASITGAIPVPAASTAIIGENAIMINHIGSIYGHKITKRTLLRSIGIMGAINVIGKNLFIEASKMLTIGTGNVWATPALCVLGAATAGMQTYMVGLLAIEIAKQGGKVLDFEASSSIAKVAKETYSDFLKEWKGRNIAKPSL